MRVPTTAWLVIGAMLASSPRLAHAQDQPNANAQPQNFDVTVPHAFTSPDNGETRCFVVIGCIGVPAGGWAWRAQDVGTFDASAPRPPFDPNHPRPYWSPDICCTANSTAVPNWQARFGPRCFVGYGCFGPPPGGWQWTAADVALAFHQAQQPSPRPSPLMQIGEPSLPVVCGSPSIAGVLKCLQQIASGVASWVGKTPGWSVATQLADMASGVAQAYAEIVQNKVAVEHQASYFDGTIDTVLNDNSVSLRDGSMSLSQAVAEAVNQIRWSTYTVVSASAVQQRMIEIAREEKIEIANQR
jgi:hypothetical protein